MNRTLKTALAISITIHVMILALAALWSPPQDGAEWRAALPVVEIVFTTEDPIPTTVGEKSSRVMEQTLPSPAPSPILTPSSQPPFADPPRPPEKKEAPPMPTPSPSPVEMTPRTVSPPTVAVVSPAPIQSQAAPVPIAVSPAAPANSGSAVDTPSPPSPFSGTGTQPATVATPAIATGAAVRVRGTPAYRKRVEPEYPVAARKRRQEGTVLLHVQLDFTGRVEAARVAQSSGFTLLDEAALKAVRAWEFEAAHFDGRPVASEAEVPVRFRITP